MRKVNGTPQIVAMASVQDSNSAYMSIFTNIDHTSAVCVLLMVDASSLTMKLSHILKAHMESQIKEIQYLKIASIVEPL